jgi:tRNA_anti-like
MRKKVIFSIGILMLCIATYAFYLYSKPHTSVDAIAPAVTISATDLYSAFAQNEADANKKYIDKVILVKGTVSDVSRTDSTLTVLLESDNIAGGVSCNILAKNTTAAVLKSGQPVSIKGRCSGFLADVMLADCVVEK